MILDPVAQEFNVDSTWVRFTTCSLFLGLCLGASLWGLAADIIGRRIVFNTTLFLCGVFGVALGGAPTWIGLCGLSASLGLGVGGNLPVDGVLFLEYIPAASASLLALLSAWWPFGQLVGSLVGWAFLVNYSCDTKAPACSAVRTSPGETATNCCSKANNMGWRYFMYTMGALTLFLWILRFFFFRLYESPKFLLSRGRQEEAVASVQGIAYANQTRTWLTVEVLNEVGGYYPDPNSSGQFQQGLPVGEIVRRNLSKFSLQRIGPLFHTKRLGFSTTLIWFCWATIGLGYPLFNAFLPQYISQSTSSPDITYRNYAITSAVGVTGSIFACLTVDIPYIGRKGSMAFSTVVTGVLLFCFTVNGDPDVQLACSSLEALFQNWMYGCLYMFTPELFPAPVRGSGTGIGSFFNRVGGLCAPLVAIYASDGDPKAPIYASGSLMLAAWLAMMLLPIETKGRQNL